MEGVGAGAAIDDKGFCRGDGAAAFSVVLFVEEDPVTDSSFTTEFVAGVAAVWAESTEGGAAGLSKRLPEVESLLGKAASEEESFAAMAFPVFSASRGGSGIAPAALDCAGR
jgi:hypothetical protein